MSKTPSISEKQAPPKPCCSTLRRNTLPQIFLGITVGCLLAGLGVAGWFILNEFVFSSNDTRSHDAFNSSSSSAVMNDAALRRESSHPGKSLGVSDNIEDIVQPNYDIRESENVVYLREPLYVGVLSLEQYLDTRAKACNETWGQNKLISKVEFFSHFTTDRVALPVVDLKGIPQSEDYWHTHKSFAMLEYMCQTHLEQYDWFVRAVDDMYIHVSRLRMFLNTQNHKQRLLLGHPTFPVDDTSFTAMDGKHYCLGGPGLIFSQPLLKAICPHLSTCRHQYSHLNSDVALVKCVLQYTGVQCDPNPFHVEKFYNTYERNQLAILEDFTIQKDALTLHPLKSPWMMHTLHQYATKQLIDRTKQVLHNLAESKQALVSYLSAREHNEPALTLTKPDNDDVIVFGDDNMTFQSKSCEPSMPMTGAQRVEIQEAVRLANTSSRLGHLLDCPTLIGGHIEQLDDRTIFTTQLLCTNTAAPSETKLVEMKMSKVLGLPKLKKDRRRELLNQLVILAHSNTADSALLDLLLKLKTISTEATYQIAIYIILTTQSIRKRTSDTYTMEEIENWYGDKDLKVKTFMFDNSTNLTKAYGDVVNVINRNYPDATVLVTETDVAFDAAFLQRCRVLVRAGKQLYHPFPSHSVFTDRSLTYGGHKQALDVLWSKHPRPVCVHISDLRGSSDTSGRRQTKHAQLKEKNIKVTSALDVGLFVNF